MIIFVHGGVMPLCVHGSKVVYKDAPVQLFRFFKALNSACGLPFNEVTPEEMTVLFLQLKLLQRV